MNQHDVRTMVTNAVKRVLQSDKDERKFIDPRVEDAFVTAAYNPDKRLDDKAQS